MTHCFGIMPPTGDWPPHNSTYLALPARRLLSYAEAAGGIDELAMNWFSAIVVVVVLCLGTIDSGAAARKGRGTSEPGSNRIDIVYGDPKSADYQPVYRLLKQHQALEKISAILRPLRLTHRLLLQTQGCDGISNAWSDENSVTVCYEYIDEIWKNAPEKTTPAGVEPVDALIGPLADVFFHETGHALFRMWNIPLFGREEDAADQFSTYILLRFSKEQSRRLILGSAYQYKGDLSSPTVTVTRQSFADEHGTPAQRFFNLLCMAYGADPKLFGDAVGKGFLPEDRAVGCEHEYMQISHAFSRLIGPHIDKVMARKLHKHWLPPASTRPPRWRSQ